MNLDKANYSQLYVKYNEGQEYKPFFKIFFKKRSFLHIYMKFNNDTCIHCTVSFSLVMEIPFICNLDLLTEINR